MPRKDGGSGQAQANGGTTRTGKWLRTPLRCVLRHFPVPFLHPGGSTLNERYRVSFARALIPVITTCRNYIDKETAYVTSSTGSVFEQREKDMRGATSIVDAVIKFANPESHEAEALTNHAA